MLTQPERAAGAASANIPPQAGQLDYDALTAAERAALLRAHPMPSAPRDGYGRAQLERETWAAIEAAAELADAELHLSTVTVLSSAIPGSAAYRLMHRAHYHAIEAASDARDIAHALYIGEMLERPDLYDGALALYRTRGIL